MASGIFAIWAIIKFMTERLMEKAAYIDQPEKLEEMVEAIRNEPLLAVDTESNGLFAYQEQVCLIQISTPRKDYLIDTLALSDISVLDKLFADKAIEKIFHAAEYDLITLKRDYGFEIHNIFDTMVAGRILGYKKLGLAAMLESHFNVHVDKRYQKANWGKRPLPVEQIEYARLDTHYLIDLRHLLMKQLIGRERLVLAREDFNRLTYTSVPESMNGNSNCWKIVGRHDISPQQAAVLKEVCAYREEQAKRSNLPLFKVLGNQTLVQIAIESPESKNELSYIKGMTPRNIRKHSFGLLKAVRTGLKAAPVFRPNHPRPGDDYLQRLDDLRNWRKQTGREEDVESDIVLPRDILEKLARKDPQTLEEVENIMADLPWRFKRYGQNIHAIIMHRR